MQISQLVPREALGVIGSECERERGQLLGHLMFMSSPKKNQNVTKNEVRFHQDH